MTDPATPEPELVVVWGYGRHGGGASAARFWQRRGVPVRVVDTDPSLDLPDDLRVDARTDQTPDAFDGADLVVVNPAIPLTHPLLRELLARGVPLTSEFLLTAAAITGDLVLVTGTAGKSTFCRRLAASLEAAGRTVGLGGNFERDLIGLDGSLLDELDELKTQPQSRTPEVCVLEVSSFQLAHAEAFGAANAGVLAARAVVLTSLSPNHLDWHDSMASYVAAKQVAVQAAGERVVLPPGVLPPDMPAIQPPPHAEVCLAQTPDEQLAAVLGLFGIDQPPVSVPPLPHRMQTVEPLEGVCAIDDSASTVPASVVAALDHLGRDRPDDRVVLILGGRSKGLSAGDLDRLARAVAPRTAAVATIGETGSDLARLIAIHGGKVRSCRTLGKAVKWGRKIVRSAAVGGGVLLLSPGMASTDQFIDYRDRGRRFADLVRAAR